MDPDSNKSSLHSHHHDESNNSTAGKGGGPEMSNTPGSGSNPPGNVSMCAGCGRAIRERFLLRACDKLWHEGCLKCACCDAQLAAIGNSLFTKGDLILCKRDYLRWANFSLCFASQLTETNAEHLLAGCLARPATAPRVAKRFPPSRWWCAPGQMSTTWNASHATTATIGECREDTVRHYQICTACELPASELFN